MITILVGIGHLSFGELGVWGGLLKRVIKIFNDLFRCPLNSRSSIYIELILYNINDIITFMGKRDPKPQFTDVACPNHSCKSYGLTGKAILSEMELL